MVEVLATAVRKKVVSDIQEAQFYGIMADTTPDASHQDRLAVGVRYVNKDGKTQERLLEVVKAVDKTGVGLANEISRILTKNELDIEHVAFQSYDFARSMSGEFKGTQQKFSEIVGRIVPFIPCQAHRLNTFVKPSCNASDIIADVFSVLKELYVFLRQVLNETNH